MTPKARRGLELMQALGKSSTAKYETMQAWLCEDNRVHGGILYHGASTGRWTGKGVQPHNFPKGTIKSFDMEEAWLILKEGTREEIQIVYGSVMNALSAALRGAIVPSPGHELFVADYAAIEARVLLWLAGDEGALDIFRRGDDIYLDMASSIYGYACNKKDHGSERQLGKVAILGLGYQMGASKFVDTALTYGITLTDDFARVVVDTYRSKYWRVKQMWTDQEEAAIKAVHHPYTEVHCGLITWFSEPGFLYGELPSGRYLAYPNPEVRMRTMPWGGVKEALTYMGIDTYTRQWKRQVTYGGMIVENITQAVARDLMAQAMLRCEQSGTYQTLMSVHDELIAQAPIGVGDVHEFEALMAECPPWAEGCPVTAEGWKGARYRK